MLGRYQARKSEGRFGKQYLGYKKVGGVNYGIIFRDVNYDTIPCGALITTQTVLRRRRPIPKEKRKLHARTRGKRADARGDQ